MPAPADDERPPRTLEGLKKEAKGWLKLIRAGDTAARARLARIVPDAPPEPVLRDVQHALALEHGCAGWTVLKTQLGAAAKDDPDREHRSEWFLEHACIDPILTSGPSAQASHQAAGMRILSRHPEVARANIHTAAVCGDLDRVAEILAARPETASERGGPVRRRYLAARESRWTPLLHLCYGRAPIPPASDNAVGIALALLDHGADPNAYFEVGSHPSRYTCLTGLAGGGEEATPPHPQADALVPLLLERGANPVDIQFIYNTSLSGDVFRWLDLLYETSVRLGREHEWTEPRWNPKRSLSAFDWLLRQAIEQNDSARADWLMAHGARPDVFPFEAAKPDLEAPFTAGCFALDRKQALELLAQHPEFLRSHVTLFAAAAKNRADVVAFVLDLGLPIDVEDASKQQALHIAASNDAFDVVKLLVARGADLEAKETNWSNTPLDHAIYGNQLQMIELLTSYSRDVYRLAWTGNVSRLRDLLRVEPELAKVRGEANTPLMWLPDDEAKAIEVVTLLLAHGADAGVLTEKGETAAQLAARRGLDEAAALLRAAAFKNRRTPSSGRRSAPS
jgi:hypothetical protein